MKCISLLQPYASLVMLGIKTLETRSFPIPKRYTGRLYIHASKRIPGKVYEQYLRELPFRLAVHSAKNKSFKFTPSERFITDWDVLTRKELDALFPLGAILGHVCLGKSWPAWDLAEEWKKQGRWFTDWQREFTVGDLGSDRFAWELSNPVNFDNPIPAKGTISPILWDATKYLKSEITKEVTNG